jgi:hypothetical protein
MSEDEIVVQQLRACMAHMLSLVSEWGFVVQILDRPNGDTGLVLCCTAPALTEDLLAMVNEFVARHRDELGQSERRGSKPV